MTGTTTIDETRAGEFVGQALGDVASMTTVLLATVGDRLGLFTALAGAGRTTSGQLADRAGIDERYAREWLAAMTAAGYLDHDSKKGTFVLPDEHVAVLATESGPVFFGGIWQELSGTLVVLDRLTEVFRSGGGVGVGEYSPDFWDGLTRFTNGWFENLLVPVWLPEMPDAEAALQGGAEIADVGCGHGRALIKLALEFPGVRGVGYDAFAPAVDQATANAKAAGVDDRVRFEVRDVTEGLPATYDVITTFDVVHDAVDPLGLLRAIREGLRDDGTYVCVDINAAPDVAGNTGPVGTLFYGFSLLYCMTTSLARGGAGLGTCGFHEHKVNELCTDAGFSSVRRLPLENPFNNVYEIR
jgi:SAM-dependent methyltransferase